VIIFVGGTGRSGTTLLGQILQRDGRFAVFYEPKWLFGPGGLADYAYRNDIDREEFIANLLERYNCTMLNNLKRFGVWDRADQIYTPETWRHLDYMAATSTRTRYEYARFFMRRAFGMICPHVGKTDIVIKEPACVGWASFLQMSLPDAKFVHVIRDPRDVAASVVPRKWGPIRYGDFPWWYHERMKQAWDQRLLVDEDNYAVMELERLVGEPDAQIFKLYEALGLEQRTHEERVQMASIVDTEQAHIDRYCEDLNKEQETMIIHGCWQDYRRWHEVSIK